MDAFRTQKNRATLPPDAITTGALLDTTPIGAAFAAPAAAPRLYPVEDFFCSAEQGNFRLSDDGAMLAFMRPVGVDGQPPRQNIFVQSLQGATPMGKPRQITSETARDIDRYSWKGTHTILYSKDFGGDENFHVLAVNAHSGEVLDLTPYERVSARIKNDLDDDPDHILLEHNHRDQKIFDIYRVNVHTGESVLVAQNPGNVVGWQVDHAGKVRAAVTNDDANTTLLYRDDEEQPFRPIITTNHRIAVSPALFTFDNKQLYAFSNRGRDTFALVRIDPAQPDAEEVLFDPQAVDLREITYSRRRQVLTYARYETDKPQYKFFDTQIEGIYRRLADLLPGYQLRLQAKTPAEDKFIVAADNDRTPGARYLYDVKSDTLSKLADINPALSEADMAPVQPITFQSRDGLTLHGYLTLPVGQPAQNLPVIVHPHGGPWTRDYWGYDPAVQFMANQGFGVLQVNFRGSRGYGRKFWEAGFGQWGLAMQDDITDGVKLLISKGIADPKRIGIYGASYGGYATLAGITFTPDLYAAAVDYVGISNLFTFINTIRPEWTPMLGRIYEMIGHPEKDKERLAATSPALHVDRVETPLFVAQGARDPRVKKAESDQMVEALRARGVEVDYMVEDNEGHGYRNQENKFKFYKAMMKFFTRHLQPRQVNPPA